MSNFNRAFEELLGHEGGYVNNPLDPGGETNWGITVDVAREHHYKGDMRDMSPNVAKGIYYSSYWNVLFEELPYSVAFNIFDAGVNHGVRQSIRFLQRAVGTAPDGAMGRKTLLKALSMEPYQVVLLFNAERLTFYTALHSFKTFGRGWVNRVAHNLRID